MVYDICMKKSIVKEHKVKDYQDFTTIDMRIKKRRLLNVGDIYANQGKCKKCGEVIRSKNRHNYVQCKCGAVAVDGGSWYQRIIGNIEDFEDMTVMFKYLPRGKK